MSSRPGYAFVVAVPPTARFVVLSGAVGRVLYLAMPFCLLSFGLSSNGSAMSAGAVSAAFAAAAALGLPLTAGWAVRRPRAVLAAAGTVSGAALIATAGLDPHVPVAAIATAAIGGATFPPFGPLARTIWPALLPLDLERRALAFEASLTEVLSILGPLLVAGVAAAVSATWALLGFASATTTTALLFGNRYAALQRLQKQPRQPPDRVSGAPDRPLILLLGAVLVSAAALGILEVALAVNLRSEGLPASEAGVLQALLALGSGVGGLGYGLLNWQAPALRRYAISLAAVAVSLALIAGTHSKPDLVFGLVLLLAGAPFAAATIEEFGLIQARRPPERLASRTGLLISVYAAGQALGVLIAGSTVELVEVGGLLGLAAASVLVPRTPIPIRQRIIKPRQPTTHRTITGIRDRTHQKIPSSIPIPLQPRHQSVHRVIPSRKLRSTTIQHPNATTHTLRQLKINEPPTSGRHNPRIRPTPISRHTRSHPNHVRGPTKSGTSRHQQDSHPNGRDRATHIHPKIPLPPSHSDDRIEQL